MLLLSAGAKLAPALPQVVMPLVRRRILSETKGVVLPAEDPQFAEHAALRRREGIGLLVNPLGESILGDDEARRRVDQVLEKLRRPDVDAVSIKASALVANLDVLDFDRSVERICEPLREIYRTALAKEPRGFVNLDMEEYRDLQLTVAAFTTVLDEPEFHHLEAGIVLQAYLPDSHAVLEHLGQWARLAFGKAEPGSRSASSRARTWRWKRSMPNCTTGSPRRIRRRPMSMRATS